MSKLLTPAVKGVLLMTPFIALSAVLTSGLVWMLMNP